MVGSAITLDVHHPWRPMSQSVQRDSEPTASRANSLPVRLPSSTAPLQSAQRARLKRDKPPRKTPHQLQTFPYSKQTLRASALKRPRYRRVHRRVLSWVGHVPDRAALALLRRAVARRCDCAGLAVLLRIALSRRDIRRRTWRDARSLGLLRQVSLAKQAASRPRPREMSSPGGFDHHAATTNG